MLFQPVFTRNPVTIRITVKDLLPRLLVALLIALLAMPTLIGHAQSFDIDTSNFLTTAATIFNALWHAFAVIVGLTLGLGLLSLVVREIRSAI